MAMTQATINNLKPKDKNYAKSEDNLKVIVTPNGVVAYYAYIRRRDVHLGKHPELSLRQAKMKKEALFHDMYMGKLEETKLTFKDFVFSQDFQDWSEGERKTHVARMASMKATILPILGHVKLSQLNKTDIQRYKNKRAKHVKKTTINRELNDISSVLTQANEMEYINTPIKVKKYSEDRGKERRALEDWEIKALRESAYSSEGLSRHQYFQKKHIGLIVDIALWCGLRKGEILALTWGNIVRKGFYLQELDRELKESGQEPDRETEKEAFSANFSDHAFNIKAGKTGQSRFVPISESLMIDIVVYYQIYVQPEESFELFDDKVADAVETDDVSKVSLERLIFQPEDKDKRIFPFSKVDNSFNTARDNAGLDKDITLHSLRHNFCSRALESGMSLHTVKDLAGHASITTTEIYLHTNPRLKFEQYRMFENKMSTITQ
jgi:integrase